MSRRNCLGVGMRRGDVVLLVVGGVRRWWVSFFWFLLQWVGN